MPLKLDTMKHRFMTAFLTAAIAGATALFFLGTATPAVAESGGCYICQGQKEHTYVKFEGKDTWGKRKQAEACGCKVSGTTASCDAANYTILCEVKD